jgi:signal recognition particle subunit SRP54
MASRILGMGDVLTLIEKAEREYDSGVAEKSLQRLQSGRFTFDDFLEQLAQVKKMGPLTGVLGMLPGIPKEVRQAKIEDRDVARVEAIVRSMTPAERDDPSLISGSRRLRIANGSGMTTGDVNNLLRQFKEMQKVMKSLPSLAGGGRGKAKKGKKGGRVTPRLEDLNSLR